MSYRESPLIAAKQVNKEKLMFLYLFESQNKQHPRNANPIKTGIIPAIALAIMGKVNAIVLVMSEY
jgi:hypothetical protein